jgi:hypothetical protein
MFSFVLYSDDSISMHLNWFGLGALTVVDKHGGRRRAHPIQKQFFRAVADELQTMGVSLSPSDPVCRSAFREIAKTIYDFPPDGLVWRTAYAEGPKALAQGHLQMVRERP